MTTFNPEFKHLRGRPDEHKLYISGPIKGFEDGNKPAFRAAANALMGYGFKVINPHDVPPFIPNGSQFTENLDPTYEDFMRSDIAALVAPGVTGFAYLPDWEQSRGVPTEMQVAQASGIQMHPLSWWLNKGDRWMLDNHIHEYANGETETVVYRDYTGRQTEEVIGVRFECELCGYASYDPTKDTKVGNP